MCMNEPKPIELTDAKTSPRTNRAKKLTGGLALAAAATLFAGTTANTEAKPQPTVEVGSNETVDQNSQITSTTPTTEKMIPPVTATTSPESSNPTTTLMLPPVTATTSPQTTPETQPDHAPENPSNQLPETN